MGWLSDLGNAVSSAVGAVGDVVEGAVDAVTNTVEDVADTVVDGIQGGLGWANGWLCRSAGSVGCRIGNIVLGSISGVLEGVQDIAGRTLGFVKDLGGALGALLRGDFAGFISKLGNTIADVVLLGFNIARFVFLGTVFGGIRDAWQAEDLRRFVEQLVNERFSQDPLQLARIREHLGLNDVSWGFPMEATHRVFRLDSGTAPLWRWHQDGAIDLYAMAGLLSFDSFNIRRRRTMMRSMDNDGTNESSLPINRWKLAHYIERKGEDVRIQIYALSPDAVKDYIQVAIAKFKKLGINLKWNDGGRFEYFARNTVHDIATLEELTFDRGKLGQYLLDKKLRNNPLNEQCNMLALAAFQFVEGAGQTSGRYIREASNAIPCNNTPDRDDSCCSSINYGTGAGVIYHDDWPVSFFRYVLAHEGGHLGLCHFGHDGFQNIMFTPQKSVGLSYIDWGLFCYYLEDEPSFTLTDAKNVWRFLVVEMVQCLDPDPGPIIE